ncbi:MAG: ABC transporter ATP-binding protein [Labilithrix sp.]|nr:ABC transporter ATP-binding protein [Labilithrix sp.]MCW5810059.1 ABC transporter ATP-binding protein [Labilithrix sp.]
MIRFEAIAKSYGDAAILRDFDLVVREGELLVMLGESGSGKTTALKMVNRLVEPSAGRVLVAGEPVASRPLAALRRSIGYVFQRFGLFPHMTIAENVGVAPRLSGWQADAIERRVDELLELVALAPADHRARYPHMLSGGQQQRVGLARALALEPHIMLLDEPFGALDPLSRDALQVEYRRLHDRLRLTTVMVTHDMSEALSMADRVAVLSKGRIVRLGTPAELIASPEHPVVEALLATPMRQLSRLESLRATDTSATDTSAAGSSAR